MTPRVEVKVEPTEPVSVDESSVYDPAASYSHSTGQSVCYYIVAESPFNINSYSRR